MISLSLFATTPGLAALVALAAQATAGASASDGELPVPFSTRALPKAECPQGGGSENEVIVCGRRRDDERYRIPEHLRDDPPSPAGTSWAARSRAYQEESRYADTATGPGAYLNVQREAVRQWRLERAEIARKAREEARNVER